MGHPVPVALSTGVPVRRARGVAAAIVRPGGASAPAPSASLPAAVPPAELAALRVALEQESIERERLAAEVSLMRTVIEQLASEWVAESIVPDSPEPPLGKRSEPGAPSQSDLDEALLQQVGLVESEVRELRDRWDGAQLARLELNDQAAREGWLFKPRHRRQLAWLAAQLRADLGETGFDRMLFATGQPNRVVVSSVIRGSAAAVAGVQTGDQVFSYGSERVFTPNDVRRGTTSGVKGESVRLVVERNGERHSLVVPRGPLGVRMSGQTAAPVR